MSSNKRGVVLLALLLLSMSGYSAQSEIFVAQPVAQEKTMTHLLQIILLLAKFLRRSLSN